MQVVAFLLCKLWHFHYASCGIFIVQVEDFSITNTKKLLSYLSFILGGTDRLGRLAENIKSHRFTQIFSFCFILSRRFADYADLSGDMVEVPQITQIYTDFTCLRFSRVLHDNEHLRNLRNLRD